MNLSFNILKISVWHQCCSGHQLDLLRQHLRWKVITDDVQDIKSRLYTGCSIKIVCFFLQFTATHSSPSVYRRWDLHCSERYANVCTVTPIAYLPAIKYKAICLSSWSSHQVCSFIKYFWSGGEGRSAYVWDNGLTRGGENVMSHIASRSKRLKSILNKHKDI